MEVSCANYVQRVSQLFWIVDSLYYRKSLGGHAVSAQQLCKTGLSERFLLIFWKTYFGVWVTKMFTSPVKTNLQT